MKTNPSELEVVLATDCGSTTTKAILFEKTPQGWRSTFRGEAPTTVEKPLADVTIGARNAFEEVQELSGRKLLANGGDNSPPFAERDSKDPKNGIDLYVSTSSAGGGLQMVVAGVVSTMTTESAERAALGAGAIVMDAISIDDGREQHERVQKIRHLRPDIVLIAGGTDGGNMDHPLELAETILQADPRPRFGDTLRLPIIYAANKDASNQAKQILEKRFDFVTVDNLRPALEQENLGPARDAIHELFLNHVMSHAPGYKRLLSWSPVPIIPTPAGVGEMVLSAAKRGNISILAVDIGGATTDVFSVFFPNGDFQNPLFNRTVSANLGMSYSVANVLLEAGVESIQRWLPFDISADEIRSRLFNKMVRPTTIPQTIQDLILEQAVCREALRLAFIHHRRLAVGLRGVQKKRTIGDLFKQKSDETHLSLLDLDLIIGSGGVLSHAPNRNSAAFMMLDAYEPLGVTRLAVDSVFMMPHLGVFSTVHPEAAAEIFVHDCIINLGTAIAPIGDWDVGEELLMIEWAGKSHTLKGGELQVLELKSTDAIDATIKPLKRNLNVGAGEGNTWTGKVYGGAAGIIVDGRGRPIRFSSSRADQMRQIINWYSQFHVTFEDNA